MLSLDVAFGIQHLDQHIVLAARQVNQDDGVALATSDAALWAKALVASKRARRHGGRCLGEDVHFLLSDSGKRSAEPI